MVKRYNPFMHFEMLEAWLPAFNIPVPKPDSLPEFGLIVDDIAIAFLVRTDSAVAYIDHVITDPRSEKLKRDRALKTLFLELETQAKREGFSVVTTLVNLPSHIERVKRLGYQAHGDYTLFCKVTGEI
jgi:hypothetical protein